MNMNVITKTITNIISSLENRTEIEKEISSRLTKCDGQTAKELLFAFIHRADEAHLKAILTRGRVHNFDATLKNVKMINSKNPFRHAQGRVCESHGENSNFTFSPGNLILTSRVAEIPEVDGVKYLLTDTFTFRVVGDIENVTSDTLMD